MARISRSNLGLMAEVTTLVASLVAVVGLLAGSRLNFASARPARPGEQVAEQPAVHGWLAGKEEFESERKVRLHPWWKGEMTTEKVRWLGMQVAKTNDRHVLVFDDQCTRVERFGFDVARDAQTVGEVSKISTPAWIARTGVAWTYEDDMAGILKAITAAEADRMKAVANRTR